MAMTEAQRTDAYRFFAIAFNAAPGSTYMTQLFDAYTAGMTTKQIVNVYTTKPEFTAIYPTFLDNTTFATKLVDNIVKSSATQANKDAAVADIVASLALGQSRGDVIFTIFDNLANKPLTDAAWGNTAKQMNNQVVVAKYYTETLVGSTTTLSTLQSVIANVTDTTDVSTNAAIEAAMGGAAGVGQTFTLTTGADTKTGGNGNDTFDATTNATLSAFDNISGGGGNDTLTASFAAAVDTTSMGLTITSVETVNLNSTAGQISDVTTWGTTALNASNATAGNVTVTAPSTTAVTASNAFATGSATVTGGLSQTVTTTTGNVVVSGSVGAVKVTGNSMGAATVGINGGTAVTVTETGVTSGTLSIGATSAPTGAVTTTTTTALVGATDATDYAAGNITVKGGTTVNITQNIAAASASVAAVLTGNVATTNTGGAVSVTGTANTTTVSVTQTASKAATKSATAGVIGIINGAVTIADVNAGTSTADKITTVTLNNYGNSTIDSAALNSLTLSGTTSATGTTGTLGINRTTSDTTANATTLALNLNGGFLGAISGTHAADFTTVNVATSAATTVADVTFAGATTLALTGAGKATFTANSGLGAVTAITVADGGSSFGTAIGTGVTFTAGAGNDTLTVGATTKAVNVGAGDNIVTVTVSALGSGGTITAGAGTSDTLSITEALADAADATTAFKTAVTGFEKLSLTTVTGSKTVDAAALGNFNDVETTAATALVLTGLTTGATLRLTAATNNVTTTLAGAAVASTTDTQTIVLTNAGNTAFGTVTAGQVETINVSMVDSDVTGAVNATSLTLSAAQVKSVVVTGDGQLTLTNTDTAITSLNASGIIDHAAATGTGGITWTTGALAAASAITGSATGANTVNFTAALAAVTYVGGSGADTINFTAGNTLNNVIGLAAGDGRVVSATQTWASGNNTVTLASSGAVAVTNGATGSAITLGAGNNTITDTGTKGVYVNVLGGANTITTGSGNDFINVGNSAGGIGKNVINVGSGTDRVNIEGSSTTGLTFTTLTGIGVGDTITFTNTVNGLGAASTFTTAKIADLGSLAVYSDYLAAASTAVAVTNSNFVWFQFGGNTYIVEDNSDALTFQDGVDSVVQITGLVTVNGFTTGATSTFVLA